MYLKEIISYLLWPVLIYASWLLVNFFLRMYEKNSGETGEEA